MEYVTNIKFALILCKKM